MKTGRLSAPCAVLLLLRSVSLAAGPLPDDLATLRSTPGPALPAETAGGLRSSRDGRLLATLDTPAREDEPTAAEAAVIEVPRWELHEFTLRGRAHVANPFRDAALVGEFTSAAAFQKASTIR